MEDKRLSYFFLGLGMGVAAGLLFAPKTGEETREFLKEKANEGKDFMKKRGEDLRDTTTEYVERGRTLISKQRDNLSAAVEAGRSAYRDALAGENDRPTTAEGI
ncbi:MAG: YtxH domain-containing protein [Bryobacteraceae bacterium]